jgi:hypothetical protein
VGSKDTYTNIHLINFWADTKEQCQHITIVDVKKLLPFPSTYLCETVLSRYTATKIKYQNKFKAEHEIRIHLSKTVHDFNSLAIQVLHQVKYNVR